MVCKHVECCKNKVTPKDAKCKCMEEPEIAIYAQEGCWNLSRKA
jgi:hypothetical protein